MTLTDNFIITILFHLVTLWPTNFALYWDIKIIYIHIIEILWLYITDMLIPVTEIISRVSALTVMLLTVKIKITFFFPLKRTVGAIRIMLSQSTYWILYKVIENKLWLTEDLDNGGSIYLNVM